MNHTERINSREVIDKAQVFFGVGQGSGNDLLRFGFKKSAPEINERQTILPGTQNLRNFPAEFPLSFNVFLMIDLIFNHVLYFPNHTRSSKNSLGVFAV